MARAAAHDLMSGAFVAEAASDPRAVRGFARHGLDTVLLSDGWQQPSAVKIANALATSFEATLPHPPTFVLLTEALPPATTPAGFHGAIRYPVAAGVLRSRVAQMVRSTRVAEQAAPRTLLADIALRHQRMAEQSHYEILGVAPDASLDAVKRAYDQLSLRLHPDRLRPLPDEARANGAALYVQITEAYRTLRDLSARAAYDRGRQTGRQERRRATRVQGEVVELWQMTDVAAAQKYLRLAQQALAGGDRRLALVHLRFAISLDAGNERLAERLRGLEGSERE